MDDVGTGDHWVPQIIERGAALMALRRWPEVLANEDKGLKAPELGGPEKARLLRGRGYALTELNRLEEAQAAYQESLKLDPDSELAKHELTYIAGLMAGKPKTEPGALTSVQKKPEDQPAKP
jgi:tetratricopeptide (TPR) repeat protein